MNCPHCHQPLPDPAAATCPHCGEPLNTVIQEDPLAGPTVLEGTPDEMSTVVPTVLQGASAAEPEQPDWNQPFAATPAETADSADTVAYTPPADEPPTYMPPAEQPTVAASPPPPPPPPPPVELPAMYTPPAAPPPPPAYTPPVEPPPAYTPPQEPVYISPAADQLPETVAYTPPTPQPPEQPPAYSPPAAPPAYSPPAYTPPVEPSPAYTPPAYTPPAPAYAPPQQPPYQTGAPAVGQPWPGQMQTPPQKKSRAGCVVGCLLALVLVVGLVGGGFVVLRNQANGITVAGLTIGGNTTGPGGGALIYQNTMDGSSADGWSNATSSSCFFKGGGYHINAGFICYAPPDQVGNVGDAETAVSVQQISGPITYGYGLVIRRASKGNYYAFQIDANGKWTFGKVVNGTSTDIVPFTTNAAIKTGLNQINALSVQAKGSHFVFLVNGKQVGVADDSTFTSGGIGLIGNNGIEVVFTNLSIAHIKS